MTAAMTVRELRERRKHETEESEQHQGYRQALHEACEELWDSYLRNYPRALPQFTTVRRLLTWSRRQIAHTEHV